MLVIIPNQGSQPCIKHHPAATPMDSVLYPLRRFPVSFATDTGTFGYSQAQHLFADSFRGCPLAFISIHATHVGSDNCYTPRGGSRLAFAFAASLTPGIVMRFPRLKTSPCRGY